MALQTGGSLRGPCGVCGCVRVVSRVPRFFRGVRVSMCDECQALPPTARYARALPGGSL